MAEMRTGQNNTTEDQGEQQEAPVVSELHSRKKLGVAIIVSLIIIIGFGAVFLLSHSKQSLQSGGIIGQAASNPSPTPMSFSEMTIPHLRAREYQSTLGDLELVSENVSYRSYFTGYDSDGFRVNGQLTVPTGNVSAGGWPAIIFIHGYIPPTQYQTLVNYSSYVDYLARNGFVVFKIDLRGHADSEGDPGGGYYSSDYVVDALNARAALQAADFVNPQGVGMWGHSMAGNILLRSLAARADIPGIVIWAGAVYTYLDMQKYGIDDNSYRPPINDTERRRKRQELFDKHGSPSASSVFWSQVAPTNYLSDIKGAIEIHHAVDDAVVNVGYSRDLMSLFDNTNVSHRLYEYQSGGHNITGTSFNQAMQRTVEFFKENLTSS